METVEDRILMVAWDLRGRCRMKNTSITDWYGSRVMGHRAFDKRTCMFHKACRIIGWRDGEWVHG